jgi:hypothetical protein
MADSDTSARRRKLDPDAVKAKVEEIDGEAETEKAHKSPRKRTVQDRLDDDNAYTSLYLDIFRVLTFLFLASCGLSYLISGGETFFWGMSNPPKYLQADWWKKQFVRNPLCPPLRLLPLRY